MQNNLQDLNYKESLIFKTLTNFYKNKNNLDILLQILNQNSNISLRILDWLVTNYSKKYNVWYEVYKNGEKNIFNVYLSYKNQLKAYSKKNFDPFCRRNRISINLKEINENYNTTIITTIGQLNFFKWFIENKIINYVLINLNKIDEDMNLTLNYLKNDTNKRKELSNNKINKFNLISQEINISFE